MAETTANSNPDVDPSVKLAERHVLLLQGPSSFFFRDLGQALTRNGARVTRIAFAAGDWLYWTKSAGALNWFRGGQECYAGWVRELCKRERVTDVVMLGDGRFYHRVVAEMIRRGQLTAILHVVEHGLMRPGLILHDRDGLGGNSRIPQAFTSSGAVEAGASGSERGGSFVEYAALDVGYHVASVLAGPFLNRHYVRHSLDHPVTEYAGWILKAVTRPVRSRWHKAAETRIQAHKGELFLFPLQLATDFQLRDHGVGEPLEVTLAQVIDSFAANAPETAMLVIKRHPLDNGWVSWRKLVRAQAERRGIVGRVAYVDGGSLDALLDQAAGVVTINSTVGLSAILAGVPCCVLGTAVYDIEGLSSPGGLEAFWRHPRAPDPMTANRFKAFLLAKYHVPGAFDGPGSRVGAENLARAISMDAMA